jgi:hypothetical protein
MIAFKDTYESRKSELTEFVELLAFLEETEQTRDAEGMSEFDSFFHAKEKGISLSYASMINILKSDVSLMLYNLIEFTITNLIGSIYDEIAQQELSYDKLNESIRAIWREMMLRTATQPSANYQTYLSENEKIINWILDKRVIEMTARETLPNGNLDGDTIRQTLVKHGIKITSFENYRPDLLKTVKEDRNNLAHGSVSFVEAVRQRSVKDIGDNVQIVIGYLDSLIPQVEEYLDRKEYKI